MPKMFLKIDKIQIQYSLTIKTEGTMRASDIGEGSLRCDFKVLMEFILSNELMCFPLKKTYSWLFYCQLWWS